MYSETCSGRKRFEAGMKFPPLFDDNYAVELKPTGALFFVHWPRSIYRRKYVSRCDVIRGRHASTQIHPERVGRDGTTATLFYVNPWNETLSIAQAVKSASKGRRGLPACQQRYRVMPRRFTAGQRWVEGKAHSMSLGP